MHGVINIDRAMKNQNEKETPFNFVIVFHRVWFLKNAFRI